MFLFNNFYRAPWLILALRSKLDAKPKPKPNPDPKNPVFKLVGLDPTSVLLDPGPPQIQWNKYTHTQSDIYTDISIRLALYTERAVHKGNSQEGTSLQ